jgi:hypothetical protein
MTQYNNINNKFQGSRSGLSVLVEGLNKWMGMAPLVVLIANNLSCVLNGTTSKDAGIIQVSEGL